MLYKPPNVFKEWVLVHIYLFQIKSATEKECRLFVKSSEWLALFNSFDDETSVLFRGNYHCIKNEVFH